MILLQFSAAQGPAECALAVGKALRRLFAEACALEVDARIVEQVPGPHAGTLLSVLLSLEGAAAEGLAAAWTGSMQWVCTSPYRPHHGRKNWFFGGECFALPPPAQEGEVRFETLRAGGPGGQHVNTTDSAVRATHIASGISVKVQTERSQHANRRIALLLIARRLAERASQAEAALRAERRLFHHGIERGNPVRTFRGERFEDSVRGL